MCLGFMYAGVCVFCLFSFASAVASTLKASHPDKKTFIVYREEQFPGSELFQDAIQDAVQAEEIETASLIAQKNVVSNASSPSPSTTTWNGGHPNSWWGCEDKAPEQTGFEVHTDDGFLAYASCQDLTNKCHGWVNSTRVQQVCPIACFICDPDAKPPEEGPPCYDAIVTGIRFKLGPQASCLDLANYCNHSSLWYHVQSACRMTCGLCDAHVGHVRGQCHDLEAHDEPEFMVAGRLGSCTDLIDFCDNTADSYVIRHKCPRTCGACPDQLHSTTRSSFTTSQEIAYDAANDDGSCDRRRRWGHCSTRRRRNL